MRSLLVALGALGFTCGLALSCSQRPARTPATNGLPAEAKLLPARVRRLSNIEYERTVSELVGSQESIARLLPPDVRQEGYTINDDQAVPAAWGARLDAIAHDVAKRVVSERLSQLVPCASQPSDGCAAQFISDFGRRAWRRPLENGEKSALLAAFAAGAKDAGFAGGVEIVLTSLLESPSLLYVSELGEGGPPGKTVTLTPFEIASVLAFAVRGGPPDDELLAAAASGALLSPDAREHEARRLLGISETRYHFRRFVLEWLEVDELDLTAKSAKLFPGYEETEPHMLAETMAFVDEVMVYGHGSVRALLDARFASVDPTMARFYGLGTFGPRASLAKTDRAGVLQQASFLAAHAHDDDTSPVKRGDFVMRKLLCNKVPRPAELGIEVVMPPPSNVQTTRERFTSHGRDGACKSCHATLDALGFTFEGFDATGHARKTENGKPVDTGAQVKLGNEMRAFANSVELSEWLAQSPTVSECFARHAFRYFSGQTRPKVEETFLRLVRTLPPDQQADLFEDLIAYVRSELFVLREVQSP